jgi:hypothetical protein
MALSVGTATAGQEQFITNNYVYIQHAFASTSAHSGVSRIDGYAEHTNCPAVASGYTGDTTAPNSGGNFTATEPTCGPHFQEWRPAGTASIYFHGAYYNPNTTTANQDFVTYAEYFW